MADVQPQPRNGESLSADLIAQRGFATSRRGYDVDEVRAFLGQVSSEVRTLRERVSAADTARREAEERARHPKLDEETILAAVGDETADILRTARTAATEIRSRAEEQATGLLREAQAQAQALRTEAESTLSRLTTEAEAGAEQLRNVADADAERTRAVARQEAEAIRQQADQERRLTVEAAQNIRENILGDLSRRRRVASVQIEQLRAGRERLLDAYLVVRRTLDEVTDELQRADAEARAAADVVGEQMAHDEPEADLVAAAPESPEDTAPHPIVPAPPGPTAEPEREPEPPAPAPSDVVVTPPTGPAPGNVDPAPGTPPEPPVAEPTASEQQTEPPATALTTIESGETFESVRILRGEAVATTPRTGRSRSARRRANSGPRSPVAKPEPEAPPPAEPEADDQVEGMFARIRADQPETDQPETGTAGAPEATETAVTDGDELLLQRRDKAAGEIETRLARRLKRALQDEQNDLLDRIRNQKGAPVAAEVLPAADDQRERIVKAGRPLLEEAGRAGAKFARQLFQDAGGAKTSKSLPEIDELVAQLATDIVDPLRRRLEQAAGDTAGDDTSVLVDAVGAAYREWKTQRIEQVAGDHVSGAFSRGAFAAVPEGAALRWVVEDLGGPCPDCDDNVLAGSQRKGEEWPTGQLFPPAHAGCRCVLVPGES